MVHKEAVWKLVENHKAGRLSRRDFLLDAAAMGFSATAIAGALTATTFKAMPALAQDLPEVARENTVVACRSAIAGKFDEAELWNPFIPAASHQLGPSCLRATGVLQRVPDKIIMWLAESYEYAPDYMTLTVKTRPDVTWSDGTSRSRPKTWRTPSTTLVELGSAVKWGANVQQFVETAVATDANTVVFNFKVPAPRFFEFISYKFDIGVYIVPKHIFEGQDWTTFTTSISPRIAGHHRAVEGCLHLSQDQKVLDRTDTWWGVDAGVGKLPAPSASSICQIRASRAWHRHHLQPVRHHHRHSAGDVPDRLRRQRQGHHLDRPRGAIRQRRLVAAFPLPEQRSGSVGRPQCPLGDQLLHRPRADHRGRLDAGPVSRRPCSSRTTRGSSRSSKRSPI